MGCHRTPTHLRTGNGTHNHMPAARQAGANEAPNTYTERWREAPRTRECLAPKGVSARDSELTSIQIDYKLIDQLTVSQLIGFTPQS